MILYTFFAAAAITAVYWLLSVIFRLHNERAENIRIVLLILTIFLFVLSVSGQIFFTVRQENLQEQYEFLQTYFHVVADCSSETVRYDYFTKLNEFNASLESLRGWADDFFCFPFFKEGWDNNYLPIYFSLNS
jgi:predicted PurR-regulated permease PerM